MTSSISNIVLLGGTSLISARGLHLSYENITRLRQYEEQSEKAAKYSNTAADRLHKTRTTQASGTISLVISFLTSTFLILATSYATPSVVIAAAVGNAIVTFMARAHMAGFWNKGKQARIPFVEKFNEAERGSESVVRTLAMLCVGWVGAGMVWMAMTIGLPGWIGVVIWGLGMGVWNGGKI